VNDNNSSNTGIYRIKQVQEAEPDAWLDLCRAVTFAYRYIRTQSQTTGHPSLTICEHSGNTSLRFDDSLIGLGVISFNGSGARQQAGDAFILTRGMHQTADYSCNTNNLPYGFLVRVVILLANYYCPATWQINTDIPLSDWQQTADWIAKYLNLASRIPDLNV